jgi:hypothetical protein
MALIDVRPPSCAAAAGIHAADVSVRRLILWLRDRPAESEVFALDCPMCVIFHFLHSWLGLLALAQLPTLYASGCVFARSIFIYFHTQKPLISLTKTGPPSKAVQKMSDAALLIPVLCDCYAVAIATLMLP